jgi:t-SNARE complex subunit (syntaxin)
MKVKWIFTLALVLGLSACSNVYYQAMESVGVHKREIMVDRVEEARDSQKEAKEEFLTALEQFKSVVDFQGGNLEKEYNRLNDTLQRVEDGADEVHERIAAVEDVSKALFKEWRAEIDQYNSETLRRSSRRKYDAAQNRYAGLMQAMKLAESRLEPALIPLRDQVLFLKHNLNARAIAGLSSEVVSVQTNVDNLVRDMERAIAEADAFIASLEE